MIKYRVDYSIGFKNRTEVPVNAEVFPFSKNVRCFAFFESGTDKPLYGSWGTHYPIFPMSRGNCQFKLDK